MKNIYYILLYYCYSTIKKANEYREKHHLFCIENNIRGRIIISKEGINGTVSGKKSDCKKYMRYLKSDKRFNTIDFKIAEYSNHVFKKLNVRLKNEIVNSGMEKLNPNKITRKYIESCDFKDILRKQPENIIILDVRSKYEHNVGKFKNALTLDIDNFRDFKDQLQNLEIHKKNKVITYCTGGVRCEKASRFLLQRGFKDVYQLRGGIIKYGIEENGENFDGKCYVFDNRVVIEVNKVNPKTIAKCYLTGMFSDRMVNCANPECNIHVPMSEKGAKLYNGCCSESCMNNKKTRNYNGTGYYEKRINGYNPYIGYKNKARVKE